MGPLSVLMELFLDYPVGLVHVGTGKTGGDTAASLQSYESIVVPAFQVSRHPITPLCHIHPPDFALPGEVLHFNCADLAVGNPLAVAERKEVTFDDDLLVSDGHVFVVE